MSALINFFYAPNPVPINKICSTNLFHEASSYFKDPLESLSKEIVEDELNKFQGIDTLQSGINKILKQLGHTPNIPSDHKVEATTIHAPGSLPTLINAIHTNSIDSPVAEYNGWTIQKSLYSIYSTLSLYIFRWLGIERRKIESQIQTNLNNLKYQGILKSSSYNTLNRAFEAKDLPLFRREWAQLLQRMQNKGIVAINQYTTILNHLASDAWDDKKVLEAVQKTVIYDMMHELSSDTSYWMAFLNDIEKKTFRDQLEKLHLNETVDETLLLTLQSIQARLHLKHWILDLSLPHHLVHHKQPLVAALVENKPTLFAKNAKIFFEQCRLQHGNPLQATYFSELAQSVDSYTPDTLFTRFNTHICQEKFIKKWETKLHSLHRNLQQIVVHERHVENLDDSLINRLLNVYEGIKKLTHEYETLLSNEESNALSPTLMAAHTGLINRTIRDLTSFHFERSIYSLSGRCLHWEKMDELIEQQLKKEKVAPVLWNASKVKALQKEFFISSQKIQPVPIKEKVVLYSYTSCGGGHLAAAKAIQSYFERNPQYPKMRHQFIDFPEETLLSCDPVHQIANPILSLWGIKPSSTWLLNTLATIDRLDILEFLKSINPKKPTQEDLAETKRLILREVLKQAPDMICSTYSFNDKATIDVADALGIPYVHVATDYDSSIIDPHWTMPQHRHFKHIIPFDRKDIRESIDPGKLNEEQVIVGGAPIRPEFLNKYTPEQRCALRKELNIQEDERAILIMNGLNGTFSPWPKMLSQMNDLSIPKLKVFVLCGKNEKFHQEINQTIIPHTLHPDRIQIIPLGMQNAQELSKLTVACDLGISKPGGVTSFEWASGLPALWDMAGSHRPTWEAFNAEVFNREGMGRSIDKIHNFYPLFKEAIQNLPAQNALRKSLPGSQAINPSERYPKIILDLMKTAESDSTFIQRKANWNPAYIV